MNPIVTLFLREYSIKNVLSSFRIKKYCLTICVISFPQFSRQAVKRTLQLATRFVRGSPKLLMPEIIMISVTLRPYNKKPSFLIYSFIATRYKLLHQKPQTTFNINQTLLLFLSLMFSQLEPYCSFLCRSSSSDRSQGR